MKIVKASLIAGLFLVASCSGEESKSEEATNKPDPVDWTKVGLDSALRHDINPNPVESSSISKKIQQNGELLANFEIMSQTLTEENNDWGQEIINLEINEWVRSNFYINEDDYKIKNIDTLLARYDAFLKAQSEEIGFATNWEINANASVEFNNNGLVAYALSTYSYTGGAHGNATILYRTYDLVTGKRLGLEDFFKDTMEVQNIINKTFNKTAPDELKNGIDVDELPITSNVVLGKDTIAFFYNTYEVGPYSLGPVEVLVPTTELQSNLKVNLK